MHDVIQVKPSSFLDSLGHMDDFALPNHHLEQIAAQLAQSQMLSLVNLNITDFYIAQFLVEAEQSRRFDISADKLSSDGAFVLRPRNVKRLLVTSKV